MFRDHVLLNTSSYSVFLLKSRCSAFLAQFQLLVNSAARTSLTSGQVRCREAGRTYCKHTPFPVVPILSLSSRWVLIAVLCPYHLAEPLCPLIWALSVILHLIFLSSAFSLFNSFSLRVTSLPKTC